MKAAVLITAIFGSICIASLSLAATTEQSPSGTISSTNQTATTATSSAVFTNSTGQTFTADQLAENLKNLRSAIEQAMPMVTAITETYSNSAGKDKSWTGRLSDFVSGALSKDGQSTSGQSPSKLNEVVGAVRGLWGTNSSSTASSSATDANTVQKLVTLQTELKPVLPTLDQLNVASSGAGVISSPKPLTPTGR